ncbi:MAG: hypothetical protein Kow0098_24920 [Ignavibacteriaceae bacterium]
MDKETLLNKLAAAFPEVQFSDNVFREELTINFDKTHIVPVCKFLKNDVGFDRCVDITAIDWAKRRNRFTVVYNLFSVKNNFRIRLKCDVDESDCRIDSVSGIWKSANWYERETFDMYGIEFSNHPDLRRMYMPEDFEYYPLRKDFPLMGIPGSLKLPKK